MSPNLVTDCPSGPVHRDQQSYGSYPNTPSRQLLPRVKLLMAGRNKIGLPSKRKEINGKFSFQHTT